MKLFTSTFLGLTSLTVVAGSAAQVFFSKSFQLVIARVLQHAEITQTPDAVNTGFWVFLIAAPVAIMAVMMLLPQLMEVPNQGLGSIKREDFVDGAKKSVSKPIRARSTKPVQATGSSRRAANGKLGMNAQLTFRPAPIMIR